MVDEQEPTRREIWKRFESHSAAIAEVRSGQAATSARLDSLESAVDSGFRTLSSELRNISERVNQPDPAPNYTGYIAIALGLLGMFGAYSVLITSPLASATQRNAETNVRIWGEINQLKEHRQRTATLEAEVRNLHEHASESREFMRESQFIHGQREELGKRVDDIDTYGSRRWNESKD